MTDSPPQNDLPPAPALGLDLDGTIDENPAFFAHLAALWPAPVTVITYRRDRAKAVADLARLGVRYDELVLVERMDAKAAVIAERGIGVYVDDQDEMTANVPEGVTVLKLRNGGNFDYDGRRYYYSDKTGENLDDRRPDSAERGRNR